MDIVADAASSVMRHSLAAAEVAAEELTKRANSLATAQDPLAWLAGDGDAPEDDDVEEGPPPPPIVPVPLAALQPWGASFGGYEDEHLHFHPAASSRGAPGPPDVADYMQAAQATAAPSAVPFVVDPEVNAKVFLWHGDLCALEVDALVVPSAAGFAAGASCVFPRIQRHGGRDLRVDLRHLDPCRSGEARLTKAYHLPSPWLLLTIGPKYKDKYECAAQNTLNGCYRECCQQLVEAELRTLGMPCVWYERGFPLEQQTHVALRTVRRCLERMRGSIDAVVFVADTQAVLEHYEVLLPIYFPRTGGEARMALSAGLPGCDTEWGEIVVEERRIRISSHIVGRTVGRGGDDASGSDADDHGNLFSPCDDSDRGFLNARSDMDEAAVRRLDGTMLEAESPEAAAQICLRYLRHARDVRAEPEDQRFVYRTPGRDRFDRRVVVLLGARLPARGVRDERTLPLFMKELELLCGDRFTLFYANSGVQPMDSWSLEVLHEMLAVISARYRDSLDQLYVLHPGLWFRAAFIFGRAVSEHAANVWHDTFYLESLVEASSHFAMQQLSLPQYVHACDVA